MLDLRGLRHPDLLETDQKPGGLDGNQPGLEPKEDGSFTNFFGPEALEGCEGHCVQAMPGKTFSTVLRLCGPLEAWFARTWRPFEIDLTG